MKIGPTGDHIFGLRKLWPFWPDGIVAKFFVNEIVTIFAIVSSLNTAGWSLLRLLGSLMYVL